MIPRPSPFHPRPTHRRRAAAPLRAGVAAVLIAVSVALTGCTPGAAPKPTPTPLFTSEADAFRAAEQVYRAYVEAGNASRNGMEAPDPTEFLTGTALESAIKSSRELKEQGLSLSGEIKLLWFSGIEFDPPSSRVTANACVDVSATRVHDIKELDVTPANRPLKVALNLRFERAAKGKLLISSSKSGESPCNAK